MAEAIIIGIFVLLLVRYWYVLMAILWIGAWVTIGSVSMLWLFW